jgi:hypothetical protein
MTTTASGTHPLTVDTPRFPDVHPAWVQVAVATYGRLPSQTIELTLLGARGERLRSCRIPPSDYRDNGMVRCPVARPDRVRHIRVAVGGRSPFALYAVDDGGKFVAGSLVQEHHFGGLGERLAALRDRVGVTRPALASPILLFAFLAASIALFGTALLIGWSRR